MKIIRIFFVLCLLLPFLGACYGVNVPKSDYGTVMDIPPDAKPSPFRLGTVTLAIPRGETIASVSPRGTGVLCGGSYGMVPRAKITAHFDEGELRDMFNDTLDAQGYDISGRRSVIFDEDEDILRSTFTIGARIRDLKMDLCERRTFWMAHDLGVQGEAAMTVEWTIYDRLNRAVVHKITTRGYSRMDLPNYEGIGLLLDDSFAGAAHNLGADADFHNLIVYGKRPNKKPDADISKTFGVPGNFDPLESVTIVPKGLSKTALGPGALDQVRRVAVLVSAGEGHGSGFFITQDGHILTNAHVVGDAGLVRVVSSNGKYKMVAEVLRRDRVRDVALLRVQKLPEGFTPPLRAVRLDIPRVGEQAFAIGTPLQERNLQDTVTHGMISAWRPRHRNDRQSYIQADITIHPGNSGGPLLDANGNITGIAVSGVPEEGGTMAGLNYFVPVVEALETLDITLAASAADR